MNKTLSATLIIIAVLALAGIVFFAGSMYAFRSSMMASWNNSSYGPNMMSSYNYNTANITPLTIDQVKTAATKYLEDVNNSDLEVAEIMTFDNNGYAIIKEASTGIGAFELLVDPVSQVAYPEHGPNMMWNIKYSGLNHENMMGKNGYGMMGGYGNTMMQGWSNTTTLDLTLEMTVAPEQAVEYAQQHLDANIIGASAEHPMQFYGYYTLDFEKDGKVAGMLSVNGYSGQVFLHTWHGAFIEETEFE